MIKISINIKLNEWIIVYEVNDIIIFIKYIYYSHDIKIKTYNNIT